MQAFKAIVYERRSNSLYYADVITTQEGFIRLKNVKKRVSTFQNVEVFSKGSTYVDSVHMYYAENCRDMMLSNDSVRIELIYDIQEIGWTNWSKEDVTKSLLLKKEEYQKKLDEEKSKYIESLNYVQKFLYRVFG